MWPFHEHRWTYDVAIEGCLTVEYRECACGKRKSKVLSKHQWSDWVSLDKAVTIGIEVILLQARVCKVCKYRETNL